MNIIRWILFVPVALICGSIAGALTGLFYDFFLRSYYNLGSWHEWLLNGAATSIFGIVIGYKIVPNKNNSIVKFLLGLFLLLAIINVAIPLMSGDELIKTWSGVGGFFGCFFSLSFVDVESKFKSPSE